MRAYDRLIDAMAVIAGVLLGALSLVIIYDALLRSLHLGAAVWAIDITGIAIIYMTFLAAPWLLRERGHVAIELLTARLRAATRERLRVAVAWLCAAMCLYLAWKSLGVTLEGIGQIDSSAIEAPRWIRLVPMPIGFLFLAAEFARSVVAPPVAEAPR